MSATAKLAPGESESSMMRWAFISLIAANIATLLGFGVVAGEAREVAEIIVFVFLILLAVALVVGIARGRAPPTA
jgi:uncharacterized membrane protein YtjA (UPF0391 family)